MRSLLLLILVAAPAALAQPVVPSDSLCTYDLCALRVEPGWLGESIVRGPVSAPEHVGRLGLFSNDLAEIVEPVPLARMQANAARQSQWIAALAAAGSVVALVVAASDTDRYTPNGVALGAGLGLSLVGSAYAVTARRQHSRAVWEYNRSLAVPRP